ncbi:MAG: hypothetical protein ACO21P_09275, partial [Candidatus Nanopelagicales bacterium]
LNVMRRKSTQETVVGGVIRRPRAELWSILAPEMTKTHWHPEVQLVERDRMDPALGHVVYWRKFGIDYARRIRRIEDEVKGEQFRDVIVDVEGEGARGDHVCLVHEDTEALRRISLLDAIVNNADRKGGHVLRSTAGAVVGIDHGLTFHIEPKLRTVLWGWAGQQVDAAALKDLRRLRDAWVDVEGTLGPLLSHAEIDSAYTRLESLIEAGEFPSPDGAWPSLPWPAM